MKAENKQKSNLIIVNLREEYFSRIPLIYAAAFDDEPWEQDWHSIPQFDKRSAWTAAYKGTLAGFIITFLKEGMPYISVLAVEPKYRRLGVAASMVGKAVKYWRKEGYEYIFVHLYSERIEALPFYIKSSFTVEESKEDYTVLKRKL